MDQYGPSPRPCIFIIIRRWYCFSYTNAVNTTWKTRPHARKALVNLYSGRRVAVKAWIIRTFRCILYMLLWQGLIGMRLCWIAFHYKDSSKSRLRRRRKRRDWLRIRDQEVRIRLQEREIRESTCKKVARGSTRSRDGVCLRPWAYPWWIAVAIAQSAPPRNARMLP